MSDPATGPVRLMVVDDHTLFRRGLVALLASDPSLAVVGEASDAGEAVRKAEAVQPDVILLDNHLPGATGIQSLPGLKDAAPKARIILLTVSEDAQDLQAALRAGAHGYLLKTIEGDLLAQAIHRAMRGEAVVSPEMTGKLVSAFQAAAAPAATASARARPAGATVRARAAGARADRAGREQQGNRAHPRHRRDHGEDPRAAHPAQAQPHFTRAGGRVREQPRVARSALVAPTSLRHGWTVG